MDNDKRLEYLRGLEKLKASKIKADDYTSPLEQDVMKVKNLAKEMPEEVTKIKGMTEKIDTKGIAPIVSGSDFMKKIEALRAAKAGKKVLGALPFVGAGIAALQGDPAMAADELASDAMGVSPVGGAYEALRSDDVGESPEEEKLMLAERRAQTRYKNSPAATDARFQRIRNMLGMKKPE